MALWQKKVSKPTYDPSQTAMQNSKKTGTQAAGEYNQTKATLQQAGINTNQPASKSVAKPATQPVEEKVETAKTAKTANAETTGPVLNDGSYNMKSQFKSEDSESDAKRIMEQNGLGKKYIKEDGTIDYDKLNKSKTGWKILSMLGNGLAGFGSALSGHNFSGDNGLANYQLQRRQEIIDTQKGREENKYVDDREFNKKVREMNLSTEQQKIIADYAHKHNIELKEIDQKFAERIIELQQINTQANMQLSNELAKDKTKFDAETAVETDRGLKQNDIDYAVKQIETMGQIDPKDARNAGVVEALRKDGYRYDDNIRKWIDSGGNVVSNLASIIQGFIESDARIKKFASRSIFK